MCHVRFAASLLGMNKFGAGDYVHVFWCQNSLVYDSRNAISQMAINERFDRILWLDSDMVFDADLAERLAKHLDNGLEIVTGLYITRKLPLRPVIYTKISQDPPEAISYEDYPKDSLFEVAGCGFGAVMMTVKALAEVGSVYGNPFSPLPGVGEDFSFCLRAVSIGKKIYCDSSVKLKHCSSYEIGVNDFEKVKEIGKSGTESDTLPCLDDGRGGV